MGILCVFYLLNRYSFRYSFSLQNIGIKMTVTSCQEDAMDNNEGKVEVALYGE